MSATTTITIPLAMTKQRLERWGTVTLEWILRTLQDIANNLGSLR